MTLWIGCIDIGWGQGSFCGEFPPNQAISSNPDSIFYDRFGNSYDRYSNAQSTKVSSKVVHTAMFKLSFIGYSQDEINVCSTVFSEISNLINQRQLNNSCGEPITNSEICIYFERIDVFPDPDVIATGSPYFYANESSCNQNRNLVHSSAYLKLNGTNNFDELSPYDGKIILSKLFSYFSGYPGTCPNNLIDLYTVIMHEAMHIIAFHPLILESNANMNYCTDYDLLFEDTGGNKVLNNSCNSHCYFSSFSGCNMTTGDCELNVGSQNNEVSTIAHIEGATNLMNDEINPGVRKFLQPNEKQILCDMGYSTALCPNSPFFVHNSTHPKGPCQNYTGCCTRAYHFCIGDEPIITNDDLLCHVHSSSSVSIFGVISSDFTIVTTSDGVKIVNSLGLNDGSILCQYKVDLPNYTCKIIGVSYYIDFDGSCNCEFQVQNECNNVLCFNNFNNLPNSWNSLFGYPFFFEDTPTNCNNTPDIIEVPINSLKKMVQVFGDEAVVFKMHDASFDYCQLKLSMKVANFDIPGTSLFEVWGSEYPPCDINDRGINRTCGIETTCEDGSVFKSVCFGEYPVTYSPNGITQFELVLNMNDFNIPVKYLMIIGKSGKVAFDNISVKVINCATNADFTATINPCDNVIVAPTAPNTHQIHLWDFGDGGTSTLANPPVHTYATNGNKTITHTITDNCGNSKVSTQIVTIDCVSNLSCIDTLTPKYIKLDASKGTSLMQFIYGGTIDPPVIFGANYIGYDLSGYYIAVTGKLIMDSYVKMDNTHFIFGEGAELEVYTNGTNIRNSTFKGCDRLWRGITVKQGFTGPGQSGGVVEFRSNLVSDAKYGLNIIENGAVNSVLSVFNNNVIGINVEGATGIKGFFGNKFLNTASGLLPPYSDFELNNLISTYNKCYAGVMINDVPSISLTGFGSALSRNTFDGIQNGIVAFNSGIKVTNAIFKNLIGLGRNGDIVHNYAIFGRQCNFAEINNNSFENLSLAIILDGSIGTSSTILDNIEIRDNSLLNVNVILPVDNSSAIDISNYASGFCSIFNNLMTNVGLSFHCNKLNIVGLSITENGSPSQPIMYSGTCIRIDETTVTGGYGLIENNRMTTNSNSSGIIINSSDKFSLRSNQIKIIMSSAGFPYGIFLINSENHEVRNNNIEFFGAGIIGGVGISGSMAANTLYCCNSIKGASSNVEFIGSSTGTRLKQNAMLNATAQGLLLKQTAIIGNQFSVDNNGIPDAGYGNVWIGNLLAKNLGNAFASQFRVDKTDTPSSGTYKPSSNPASWFNSALDLPVATATCIITPSCNELDYQGDGFCGTELLGQLEAGISGINTFPEYESQSTWAHQNFVYEYVQRYPSVATNSSIIASFVNNPPISVLAYHQIESAISTLYDMTNAERETWEESTLSIRRSDSILTTIYEVINITTAAIYKDIIDAHVENIANHNSLRKIIQNQLNDRVINKSNLIKNLINQMPVTYPFLTDYKTVRNAYIDGILYGKSYVKDNYLSSINSISDKCIGQYGRSVGWARDIQRYLDQTVNDGEGNCLPNVAPRSKITSPNIQYTVSPNPSNGEWIVNIDDVSNATTIQIEIEDANGSIVFNKNEILTIGDNVIKINGDHLPNGLYYLNTKVNGLNLLTKKLVKIK